MSQAENTRLRQLTSLILQAHPWHGVSPGPKAPDEVVSFIEIVPTDAVKYELDKASGHLRIDRPQRYSSFCPTLYGFIPQTYCAEKVAERAMERTRSGTLVGDGDPLDVCVMTEKAFSHGNFLLQARPVGGLTMLDRGEADDKIIAVLIDDLVYGGVRDLADCPKGLLDRLRHYFLSYKQLPEETPRRVEIPDMYGREEALEVIRRSQADYRAHYGEPETRLSELRDLLGS
jgi:inorganic pyrophosphatase